MQQPHHPGGDRHRRPEDPGPSNYLRLRHPRPAGPEGDGAGEEHWLPRPAREERQASAPFRLPAPPGPGFGAPTGGGGAFPLPDAFFAAAGPGQTPLPAVPRAVVAHPPAPRKHGLRTSADGPRGLRDSSSSGEGLPAGGAARCGLSFRAGPTEGRAGGEGELDDDATAARPMVTSSVRAPAHRERLGGAADLGEAMALCALGGGEEEDGAADNREDDRGPGGKGSGPGSSAGSLTPTRKRLETLLQDAVVTPQAPTRKRGVAASPEVKQPLKRAQQSKLSPAFGPPAGGPRPGAAWPHAPAPQHPPQH